MPNFSIPTPKQIASATSGGIRLPSAESIVDFLRTQGQNSSFTSRTKIYNDLGFSSRLGDYRGSDAQNRALLTRLQSNANTQTPQSIAQSIISGTKPPQAPAQSILQRVPPTQAPVDFSRLTTTPSRLSAPITTPAKPVDFSSRNLNLTPAPAPTAASTVAAARGTSAPSTPAAAPTQPNIPTPTTPAETTTAQRDADILSRYGISASSLIPDYNPSEADLVNDYLESAEGQLLIDRLELQGLDAEAASEEAKQELNAKYESEREALENSLAESGLAFSGIRNTQLKALADNLAASELSVDRKFASKLLDADLDLREGILKGVAELIKDAKANRKEAIDQLNAVGLAIVGDQIVPTLATIREERAAQNQEFQMLRQLAADERSEAQLEISQKRFELAEASAARAEARFEQLYGANSAGGFAAAAQLVLLNPTATENDIRAAIRSNPTVFGSLNESQINDAVRLIGIPAALQPTIAARYVKKNLKGGLLSGLTGGDLDGAKDKVIQLLRSGGGVLELTDEEGKTQRTYTMTTEQLESLIAQVNAVTRNDLKNM